MFRPAARHWFALASGFLVVNTVGVVCLIQQGKLRRDGLCIERFTPEGETAQTPTIRVRFNRDVARPGAVRKPLSRGLVQFNPRLLGACIWEDTRTLAFVPNHKLPLATAYVATVRDDLHSLDGRPLAGKCAFEFHTKPLAWLKTQQTDIADGRPTLRLAFNDRVVPAEVGKHLRMFNPDGKAVRFRVASHDVAHQVLVRSVDRVGESVKLVLKTGLRGLSGPLGIAQDESQTIDIDGMLRITAVHARCPAGQPPYLAVDATLPLRLEDAASHIHIDPRVKFHVEDAWWDSLRIRGDFAYATRYTVKFDNGLPADDGGSLGADATWIVDVPDARPHIAFLSDGTYLSLSGRLALPVDCINVNALDVSVEKIYANNIVPFASERERYGQARYMGVRLPDATVPVKGKLNVPTRVALDLRQLLRGRLAGPALVTVADADHHADSESKLVMATDLGLLTKRSDRDMLVWVNALHDASPTPGAKVTVFSRTNQVVLERVTDADGFAQFTDVDLAGDREPFVVTVAKRGDTCYICLEDCAVSTADFDVEGRPVLSKGYDAFVYPDRGVYRPGETVHLSGLVRGPRLALPEAFPVEIEVRRPDDRVLRKTSVRLSDYGAMSAAFALPSYARTGRYRAALRIPGQSDTLGNCTFLVEDFMPDRMKAEIVLPTGKVQPGAEARVVVKAASLIGHPAAGRVADCRCRIAPMPFEHPDWKGYVFFDATREWEPIDLDLGEAKLDERGEHAFTLTVPAKAATPARLQARFTASVHEIGGRAVTAHAGRIVDAYPHYVGVSRPTPDPAAAHRVIVKCAAVLPDGRPANVKSLRATLEKLVWHTALKRQAGGRYRYVSTEETIPVSTFDVALSNGRGQASLTLGARGNYRVRVRDASQGAAASVDFWSSGSGDTSWAMEKPDRIEVTTDREIYAPGDTAHVAIRSPFAGRLAVFVETDRVLWRRVMTLQGNTAEFDVPLGAECGPTAYITAIVIRPVQTGERSVAHRAVGICPVSVVAPQTRLSVKVDSPTEVRPHQPVRVPFQVTGHQGAGVAAEVMLAAVDVGVCRVTDFQTPDPWAFFHAKRRLVERTADLYSLVHPEFVGQSLASPSTPAGDASEVDQRLNPVKALRVKPVALWLGSFTTGPDGRGVAEFTAPDFDGRLRIMAVAAGKRAVGSGQSECVVANPVLVDASWPRFASTGDSFVVPVTVTNRTGRDGQATVSLDATGPLSADDSGQERIAVPQGHERTVRISVRAGVVPGAATAVVTVELNGECMTRRVELAVRPPAPLCAMSGAGSVVAGQTATLELPGGFMPQTARRTLHLTARPSIKLAGALRCLLRYPYGCGEQTASAAFGLIHALDVAKAVDPGRFDEHTVAQFIQDAIDRLMLMQRYDGGFAFWPESANSDSWLSAYVGHFLVEAQRAGYAAPKPALDGLTRYLKALTTDKDADIGARCYACYVLALAGQPQPSAVNRLARDADMLWPSSRCQLAAARLIAGDRAGANKLLGAALPAVPPKGSGPWHSDARQCAIMLSTLLDAAPHDPRVPLLVRRLNNAASQSRWFTTQENALAILALGKYAKTLAAEPADFVVRVISADKLLATVRSDQPQTLEAPDGAIKLSVQGKGRAYYYWTADGVPANGRVEEADHAMRVRRFYLDRDGKLVKDFRFKQGEVYQVELDLRADDEQDNVAVVDLLPAGLEIENPRLATRVSGEDAGATNEADDAVADMLSAKSSDMVRAQPDRVEMRDDRLLLFLDVAARRWHRYRYLVRAVTQGQFHVGPVRAECMYDPNVSSVHGAGQCVVDAD